ncbi:MAG: hypothetical protein ACMV1B_12210, partial [Prevotella sp.]
MTLRDLITARNIKGGSTLTGDELLQRSVESARPPDDASVSSNGVIQEKILGETKTHGRVLGKILDALTAIRGFTKSSTNATYTQTREDFIESARVTAFQSETLRKIEEKTRHKEDNGKQPRENDPINRLYLLGTALAASLGGIIGAIQGQWQAIKLFSGLFSKLSAPILAAFPAFQSRLALISGVIEEGLTTIRKVFSNVIPAIRSTFSNVITELSSVFKSDSRLSAITSTFGTAKNAIVNYFEPIKKAFTTIEDSSKPVNALAEWIRGGVNKVSGFFSLIGDKISYFARIFGSAAKIVSKIFYPLTVIMTIWDTVKGAIEGFNEEGIIGAISGAIKGFTNSLIMAPLDLLKDLTSWVLDSFGFDRVSKMLDSFSFESIFTQFIDAIFHPIDTISKLLNGVGDLVSSYIIKPLEAAFKPITTFFIGLKDSIIGTLQSIHIPEIGFVIPVIDKKVSIGPFYPFGKQAASVPSAVGQTTASQVPAGQVPAGQVPASKAVPGQTVTGQTTASQVPAGQVPAGQVPAGQAVTGQTATGQTATGQTTASKVVPGQAATGQAVTGQTTAYDSVQSTQQIDRSLYRTSDVCVVTPAKTDTQITNEQLVHSNVNTTVSKQS